VVGRRFDAPFRIASAPLHCKKCIDAACSRQWEDRMTDNRNILYLIVGVLVAVIGVLGYNLYQARKQPEGLQINVGPNGLKIESK
jgi:hypothetical protein